MRTWRCLNFGFQFDVWQPHNRCAQCGFYLRLERHCDSCGAELSAGRIRTNNGGELCESHLADLLVQSIACLTG